MLSEYFLLFQVNIDSEVKTIYSSSYICPFMEDTEIN